VADDVTDSEREGTASMPEPGADALLTARPELRVATSTVSVVASSLAVAILGALALHEVTNTLGRDSYGILVTVINFISISFLFADLGINIYSGREIARDKSKAAVILGQNLGLRLSMSAVMVPVVIGIGFLIYPHAHHSLIEGILLVALTLPFEAVRAVSLSYYVATIQNYKTALIGVLSQVIYVTGVVVTLHLGYGLTGCFCSLVASAVFTAAFAYVAVRRSVRFVPRLTLSLWRDILRHSVGIGAIQVVNVLYLRTNILLLSLMTNSPTVALYGLAAAVVTFLLVIPNAYMTSMMPLLVTAPPEKLTSMVNTACAYMSMIGALAVAGTTCVSGDFIDWFSNRQYAGSAPVLSILSISVLFTCVTSVFSYASFARDHHHRLFAISCAGLGLNVVLDVALIPALGARGAAIATVIVESLILVGTYAIFRSRVGNHFTAWARQARIYAVGGIIALFGHFGLDHALGAGLLRLAVAVVTIPTLFVALALLFRCFPTPIPFRELYGSWVATRAPRRAR
jgi:O-antigen/teichoic acid export membrane protein